jgi:hypothetical protein
MGNALTVADTPMRGQSPLKPHKRSGESDMVLKKMLSGGIVLAILWIPNTWAANAADSLLGTWVGSAQGFSGQSYFKAAYRVVFDQVVGNAVKGTKWVTYNNGTVGPPHQVYLILGTGRQILGAEEDGYWNGRYPNRNQISFVYSERENIVTRLPAALDVKLKRAP